MTETPEVVVERVAGVVGAHAKDNLSAPRGAAISAIGFASRRVAVGGETLFSMSLLAAQKVLEGVDAADIRGVIAATFSGENRFPALSVRLAAALALSPAIPAFDIQMACSAYPYALYLAGKLSADSGGRVLVVDGDMQSPLVDAADASTAPLFSDAATASLVSVSKEGVSKFAFLSKASEALTCPAAGPIKMDGFKVFSFVATDAVKLLRPFGTDFDWFVPHQANMYMVRQLAKSLSLESKLATCGEKYANPGSCSIPLALASREICGRVLVSGFGAGLSASVGLVRVAEGAACGVAEGADA